jgi:hypothetical protein
VYRAIPRLIPSVFLDDRPMVGVLGNAADWQWWRCSEKVRQLPVPTVVRLGRRFDAAVNTGVRLEKTGIRCSAGYGRVAT